MKNKKYFNLVFYLLIGTVMCLSLGYSAFTASINIDNILAEVRIKEDIRITGVSVSDASDDVVSLYEEYNVSSINSSVSFDNANSYITYKIEITNIESAEMGLFEITGLPAELTYNIESGYIEKDKLCDDNNSSMCNLGSVTNIYVTIRYNTSEITNTDFVINLDFDFRGFHKITYSNITNNGYPTEIIDGDDLEINIGTNTISSISNSGGTLVLGTDYNISNEILNVYDVTSDLNIVFEKKVTGELILLSDYINDLYSNDTSLDEVPNSSISYYYTDSTIGLMKDRFGSSSNTLDSGNLRYYGNNPNNYVYFNCGTYPETNCERWRIIGVFDNKIKLIRSSSIGMYSFDNKANKLGSSKSNNGSNVWSDARLMMLLNPGFEDGFSDSTGTLYEFPGSLYWNSGSGDCYAENGTSNTTTCDFSTTGIKDTTRSIISQSNWYIAASNSSNIFAGPLYERERTGGTWSGYVAVPYPSDYAYAVDFNECNKTIYNYTDTGCLTNNWMFNILTDNAINTGWLLTPYSSATYSVFYVNNTGRAYYNNFYVNRLGVVVPTLYLDSNVYYYSGDGSYDNPIRIEF